MRRALPLLALCLSVFGQVPSVPRIDHYVASASTTALTIQQPATGARRITFGSPTIPSASIYCATAQTATVKWNGTAATSTAGTEAKLPGTTKASGVTVWTASNVGAGTTGPVYNVAAGATFNIFDLSWISFGATGTATNVTIATSGTCTITFYYSAI